MVTEQQAAVIKGMLARGDKQQDIAAFFQINSGRVAEIKTGEKFSDTKSATELPTLPEHKPRFVDPKAPLMDQLAVLTDLIKNPPENSRIVVITPRVAEWILTDRNGGNRKRKPSRIKRYAEAMHNDDWLLTGEPIIFGKSGLLLDGQNRLAGCVRANKKFRTYVVFGIDDSVFVAINTAKARTPSDTFYKAGVPHSEIISPAVRWLMIYEQGDPAHRLSFDNQSMWDFYNNKLDQDVLTTAVERTRQSSKAIPRGTLAAHFYLFERKHAPTARKLAEDFAKNKGGARKLTTILLKTRKNNFGRLNDVWINALLVNTWNAYRAGESVTSKTLKWSEAKDYPAIK